MQAPVRFDRLCEDGWMTAIEGQSRPATSIDVARLAGVSRSTVSNILNGNDARFPESTRERVLAAARKLEYQPSLAGRSLVSGRSDTVVVLLPNTTFGSNLQDAVDQVVSGTSQIGGNVVVRFAGSTPKATLSAIMALRPLALVDFGVLSRADRDRLEAMGTIIVPSPPTDDPPTPPDGGIAQLQADALLERGPRALWFAALSDERLDPYGPPRLASLRSYCQEKGLPEPRQTRVPLTLTGATAALAEIIADEVPAGIACYNDDVAIALLAGARELGVNVPGTISVAGVDHTSIGQLWAPPLTTVDTNFRGLVSALSIDLRARLSGNSPTDSALQDFHFTLVRGGTS